MAGCGTLIIPPLNRPSDEVPKFSSGGIWASDSIENWSWVPIEVPQYNPPIIEDIALGAEPPVVPDIPFDSVPLPYVAGSASITPPTFAAAPVLDSQKPVIYEPPQPDDFTGQKPGDAPIVKDVSVPDAPTIVVPPAPTVSDAVIPDPIVLDLPVFTGEMPDGSDIFAPDNTFNFSEEEYSSAVLDKTTSEILRMLNGGVGIPDTTWQLILSQGAEREEQSGNKLIEEATTDFAARGWNAPPGVLDKRIREARQGVFSARNTLARDITTKEAQMELDNLKYSIAQGIALDTMLIGLHNSAQDRGLKAAEISVTISIQIMEAKISLYNSELQAYQTSANVFKTLIEAEIAKIEAYKAELQAAQLGIDVDKARIDAYNAEIRGLTMIVELHNAQVKTVLAEVQIESAKIDAYKTRVQAYSEEVRAWGLEWEGYKAAWDGQTSKASIYKSTVDAYASEVSGFSSIVKTEEIKIDAESKTISLDIERMKADTARYAEEVRYQSARTESIAKTYSASMDGYRAKSEYERNKINVFEAKLQGDISNAKAMSVSAIENARLVASQLEAIQRLNLSAYETQAKIEAQTEASRLGQFSATTSNGTTSSTSYKYDCTS